MAADGLLRVEGLTHVFGPDGRRALAALQGGASREELLAGGHTVALRDVDLSVATGETFVIMGLSGSGKSTLVRCLNRLITPTAGRVTVDGIDVLALSPRALRDLRRTRLAMVFQRFALLPHVSVLANVAFGLRIQGVARAEREARARRWIELVGLTGFERALPRTLSGGMQQRVGLARALCTDPDVLLMDEPFSALDPLIRREMQDELVRLQRALGKTIVFITHDLDEALRLGDRIAVLKDGAVVQVGTPAQIVLRPADAYVRAFVEHVNRARVLRVRHLVRDAVEVGLQDTAATVAAKLAAASATAAYVVDGARRYQGVVVRDEALSARPSTPAAVLLRERTLTLAEDTVLEDALEALGDAPLPVAVVAADGRLRGVVRPADALRALARHRLDEGMEGEPARAAGAEDQPIDTTS